VLGPPAFAKQEREAANGTHRELVRGDEGVGNGIEDDSELMEDAERDGHDDFAGGELEEFSAVAGEDVYTAATPFDAFDGAGELDARAGFTDLSGEEMG